MTVLTHPLNGKNAEPTEQPGPPEADDLSLASLMPDLERHPELDLKTLGYHLQQSDATAGDGYWHAAINEARSFLEALVISIALTAGRESTAEFRKGREGQSGFRFCRGYLMEIGFLDLEEKALLQQVYGVASAKGSHPGVTDEAWCRLARRIVWTTGHYLIRRYDAWKRNGWRRLDGQNRPPDPSRASQRSPNGAWRAWLARVVRGLVARTAE